MEQLSEIAKDLKEGNITQEEANEKIKDLEKETQTKKDTAKASADQEKAQNNLSALEQQKANMIAD
jgi:polyhydroxyalkanoate synthesis regulator phasin